MSFVGLIDTPSPDIFAVAMPAKEPMLQHLQGGPLAAAARAHLASLPEGLSFLEMALECQRLGVEGLADARLVAEDWQRSANYSRLLASYRPQPLTTTAHVFLATELVKNTAPPDATAETPYAKHMREAAARGPLLDGWQGLLRSLQPVAVPGDHLTMMTDAAHRKILGAAISQALQARAGEGATMRDAH